MNPDQRSGFTLLELVIVIAITGLLATIVFPSFSTMRARAERIVCMGNLRSLHVALQAYMIEHKQWAQVPADLDQEQAGEFWVATLKNYNGGDRKAWTCPTLARQYAESAESFDNYPLVHYLPAEFDEKPSTPYKWPTMPWAVEIGSVHGNGNQLIRADGGIKEINELLNEAKGAAVHQME